MDNPHLRAYFLAILTTLLTVIAVYMLRPFLVTISLAAVFAVVFAPLHDRFKSRLPEGFASFLTLIVGIVCVLIPTGFLGVQLFKEAQSVYTVVSEPGTVTQAQSALVSLGGYIDHTIPGAQEYFQSLSVNLGDYARKSLGWGLGHVGSIFSGTLAFLLQLFVFLMTLYYLLKEGGRMGEAIKKFSPLSPSETEELMDRLVRTINSVVRGTFVIALIQGAVTAVGFMIFGISNPVLWGTVAVFGALIPSVGTALVFIPAVLYLLFVGHTGSAIGLALFGLFGVGIIDNFLRPYLVGGKARIHPLLVLFAVLGGLALFGPGGLFLGPLVFSLLLGLLSIYAISRR
jgi:predicted PurR-regulated permease PerM